MSPQSRTYDVAHVIQALSRTTFGDLVEPSSVASMVPLGLEEHLFPHELPVVRRGLDEGKPPFHEVEPTPEDLETEPDKEKVAWAILINGIAPKCERTRALIESVADAGWIGAIAQLQLLPPQPRRKIYPWWYNPRRPKPATYHNLPSLFDVFGEG